MWRMTFYLIILLIMPCVSPGSGMSAEKADQAEKEQVPAVVEISGAAVLEIRTSASGISTEQRATLVRERLEHLLSLSPSKRGPVVVVHEADVSLIKSGEAVILTVAENDAAAWGKPRMELTAEYEKSINQWILLNSRPLTLPELFMSYRPVIIKVGLTVAACVIFILMILLTGMAFRKAYLAVEERRGTIFKSVTFRAYEIVSEHTVVLSIISMLKTVRLGILLLLFYYLVQFFFRLFPLSQSLTVIHFLKSILQAVLTAVVAVGFYKLISTVLDLLSRNVKRWDGVLIKPLSFRSIEILSAHRIALTLNYAIRALKVIVGVLILYFSLTMVFSFFELTKTWGALLFSYIARPLRVIMGSFIGFLPNIFFIAVVILINWYVLKFMKALFREIERGGITLPGFQKDWGMPTYKIVRFMIIVFTIVVLFPYLPGSKSEAFKGVSIFLGVLFSLGSTSIVANVVAGVVLTYMSAYSLGDRVRIGEASGDVIQKTILVTRIKTVKNVIITIPNAMVLGSHVINYSASAAQGGLILHTTVTIGYDVPWDNVHRVMIEAALKTKNIEKEPQPFVLQTSLDDYYVSYELNAYTNIPNFMARTYSDLHQNILDSCNSAGIEILSPNYTAVRDGNRSTIPDPYLPGDYEAPGFRIGLPGNIFGKRGK